MLAVSFHFCKPCFQTLILSALAASKSLIIEKILLMDSLSQRIFVDVKYVETYVMAMFRAAKNALEMHNSFFSSLQYYFIDSVYKILFTRFC